MGGENDLQDVGALAVARQKKGAPLVEVFQIVGEGPDDILHGEPYIFRSFFFGELQNLDIHLTIPGGEDVAVLRKGPSGGDYRFCIGLFVQLRIPEIRIVSSLCGTPVCGGVYEKHVRVMDRVFAQDGPVRGIVVIRGLFSMDGKREKEKEEKEKEQSRGNLVSLGNKKSG